jgi:hypothetical protein
VNIESKQELQKRREEASRERAEKRRTAAAKEKSIALIAREQRRRKTGFSLIVLPKHARFSELQKSEINSHNTGLLSTLGKRSIVQSHHSFIDEEDIHLEPNLQQNREARKKQRKLNAKNWRKKQPKKIKPKIKAKPKVQGTVKAVSKRLIIIKKNPKKRLTIYKQGGKLEKIAVKTHIVRK